MISDEQYDNMVAKSRQSKSLVRFFRESPMFGVDLDLARDRNTGRDIEI